VNSYELLSIPLVLLIIAGVAASTSIAIFKRRAPAWLSMKTAFKKILDALWGL
jgi:hypothetical protein